LPQKLEGINGKGKLPYYCGNLQHSVDSDFIALQVLSVEVCLFASLYT
jgi:hypothetical protein